MVGDEKKNSQWLNGFLSNPRRRRLQKKQQEGYANVHTHGNVNIHTHATHLVKHLHSLCFPEKVNGGGDLCVREVGASLSVCIRRVRRKGLSAAAGEARWST